MPYPLGESIKTDLFRWIQRFIKYKTNTLSVSKVVNRDELTLLLGRLDTPVDSIDELKDIVKRIRALGMPGVNSIAYPLFELYRTLLDSASVVSMSDINEEAILDFLAKATIEFADETKKNWRNSIQMFIKYVEEHNEDMNGKVHLFRIDLKNWRGLRGRSGDKPPSYMTEDEIAQFIDALERYDIASEVTRLRNILMVKILLYAGMRVSEMLGIQMKNITRKEGLFSISIRGKGNKYAVCFIQERLIGEDFDNWMRVHNPSSDLLFHGARGSHGITQAYVSRFVEAVCLSAGIRKEKNGAHMLRHTFATLLYKKTGDLVLLQEGLRHSDISTSRKYTHLNKDKIKGITDIFGDGDQK